MDKSISNKNYIAYCGLYCKNCSKLIKGKCPGCGDNKKASWCLIRTCCISKQIDSCALCTEFDNPSKCKKYNTAFSKLIQFVTRTNRAKCIEMIKQKGKESFIVYMDSTTKMSLPTRDN